MYDKLAFYWCESKVVSIVMVLHKDMQMDRLWLPIRLLVVVVPGLCLARPVNGKVTFAIDTKCSQQRLVICGSYEPWQVDEISQFAGARIKRRGSRQLDAVQLLKLKGNQPPDVLAIDLGLPGDESHTRKQATPPREEIFTNTLEMKFKLIPNGEFLMGSDETVAEIERAFGKQEWLRSEWIAGEHPQHRVRITQPFYIGTHEVTKEQFARFVEAEGYRTDAERDGKGAKGWSERYKRITFADQPEFNWRNWGVVQEANAPVVNVSWNDATAFCRWLSKKEGRRYRLATEAEWEYACRAGTTTRFYNGNDPEGLVKIGNVGDEMAKETLSLEYTVSEKDGYVFTSPVGRFRPNAFDLYDMLGNAAEWCGDWYDEDYYENTPVDDPQGPVAGSSRVFRGGGWHAWAVLCRSADRRSAPPSFRSPSLGFRVVCEQ